MFKLAKVHFNFLVDNLLHSIYPPCPLVFKVLIQFSLSAKSRTCDLSGLKVFIHRYINQ